MPAKVPRLTLFASAFNWAIWGFIITLVCSQFLGIAWNTSRRSEWTLYGRNPANPPTLLPGFNDEPYADRSIVCIAEGRSFVPKQLSLVLQDPKLAQVTTNSTAANGSVNALRVVKRETMELNAQIYDTYLRMCDRVDFTLQAIQDSCDALGYNVTRDALRVMDDVTSDTTRIVPRALPIVIVPFWDNAVHVHFAIPSYDGAACVFVLSGLYQSTDAAFGILQGVPRSVRTMKTAEWLQKPGGTWRNGWYEDLDGQRWFSNMLTSTNANPYGLEARQFDTLANSELDCESLDAAGASLCKPALMVAEWGSQLSTTRVVTQQNQVYVSNGARYGLFLFEAFSEVSVTNVYSLDTFISNMSVFTILIRWFVAMVAMLNSYRLDVAGWQTAGVGCLSSSRTFNLLPVVLLPRMKTTLIVFCTVGGYFEGQQSALADAWFVMYPGIIELVLYYFSLLNIIAKITYRRMSDALFGPTVILFCGIHYFRVELTGSGLLGGIDGRLSTLMLSDEVDALQLSGFLTSDAALRLGGDAVGLMVFKITVLALNLLPLLFAEKMVRTGKKHQAYAACAIETALAIRASNVGGLGLSQVYTSRDQAAPMRCQVLPSKAPVVPFDDAPKVDNVAPVESHSQIQSHVLTGYEVNRLGYLVFGGKYLLAYDDWYVLTSTAPFRVVERLWNFRINVFEVATSVSDTGDGGGGEVEGYTISRRPIICRLDDPELRAIPWYDVTACAFQ